jgi:septation ring formation regulator EzrA
MKSIHGINEKDHETIVALNERINELEEERDRLLSFIENSKNKYQNLENDFKEFSESIKNILQESQNKWFKIIQ